MPRMKIVDKLITNSLLLFNKGLKIQDGCQVWSQIHLWYRIKQRAIFSNALALPKTNSFELSYSLL